MENNSNPQLKQYALRILRELGLQANLQNLENNNVSNQAETKYFDIHGTKVNAKVTCFKNNCRVEVCFNLPDGAVTAETFMNHCAEKENIPQNHGHDYCHGPRYRSYTEELRGEETVAFSPWNNRYFIVWSERYPKDGIEAAVENCIALAKKFYNHLEDIKSMRYWNPTDEEIISKADEIIANADLHETDVDKEERAHWIEDKNSFFRGWFYPFHNYGKGTFDTLWPSSLEHAAGSMGIEGSFKYAVACRLLINEKFIAKARKACIIRKETSTKFY